MLAGKCALALAAAGPGLAQAPAAAPAATAGQDDGAAPREIVVTGSRIVGNVRSPTPLNVLTQADIQNTAPSNNLADFINQIPSVAASTRPETSRLAISSGLAGINALNLRALGEIRTLVLLDGRRSVPSSSTGLVDVNTFPQDLVKDVQIVTGGASAAYGSDAVAGVVNFVLDKEFKGLKVTAENGVSTYGDGFNYRGSVTGGLSFAEGRGNILFNGEYAHRDGIFKVDRAWNARGNVVIPNPAYTNTNGQPQFLVRAQTGTNNVLPGGIINVATGTNAANVAALRGVYFGTGGSVNRYNYGNFSSSTLTNGGDWALADTGRNIGLQPSDDRRNVYGRASFELASWITVFGEASYNWNRTLFNAGPQNSSAIVLQATNPYLVNAFAQAGQSAALAGVSTVTIGTTASDLPYRKLNNRREVSRYAGGAEGEFQLFGNKATWNAYGQYGQSKTHEQLLDIMNSARIALAQDAVTVTAANAGTSGLAIGSIACRSTLTAPTNGCVPLNRVGTGVTNPAAIAYALGNPYRDQKLEETVAGANLSFTPFNTWAGPASIAVGGEYRKERVSGYVPTEFQTGWSVGNYLPTFGSYDVKEGYVEVAVPVGLGVELNGAARATDYSTSGYVTTWKAGGTWQPIPDIRFRATRSRDIRAPNLNELYQAGTSRTNTLLDPFTGQNGVTFRETTTGNPNLKPEKADNLTVGVILQPRFLPGLSISVDYASIKVKGAIAQFFSQDIINRCFEGRTEFCASYMADPTGERTYQFFARPFNFASIKNRSIDIDASYRLPLNRIFSKANGSLMLHGLATRYIENVTDSGVPGVILIDTVGQDGSNNLPRWIYRASLTYDAPAFSVSGTARGISAGNYLNSYIQCDPGTCPVGRAAAVVSQLPTIDYNHIPGKLYVDMNLTAKIGEFRGMNSEIFLNVTNLFNSDPILVPETGLAANTTYSDLLGRVFRIGFRARIR